MDHFQVIPPSFLLAPYVKQYWFLRMEGIPHGMQRLVPTGCAVLYFRKGGYTFSSGENGSGDSSILCGVSTRFTDLSFSGLVDFISIVFQPLGSRLFFTFPLSELGNGFVSAEALHDSDLNELVLRLHETDPIPACVELIEGFLLHRLRKSVYSGVEKNSQRMNAALQAVYGGETNVRNLAATACVSYKQFKRIFEENIGANPKDFVRIIRFQKLHRVFQQHLPWTLE